VYTAAVRSPLALALVLAAALVACGGIQRMQEDLREMEGLAYLSGEVSVGDWSGAPIVVAILRPPAVEGAPFDIVDFEQLFQPGSYSFIVEPGHYRLIAFVDQDRDLQYHPGERVAPWDQFRDLDAGGGHRGDLDIAIEGPPPSIDEHMPETQDPTGESRSLYIGTVMPLASERFGAEAGRLGMVEPTRFMRDVGAGLFLLEEHDPSRTPVVFVHGISGYPQEFEFLVEHLDRSRFEAWVAQYPSGWDLDAVADILNRAINELQTAMQLPRMCIVAHSMGGLVLRRAMVHHAQQRPSDYVRGIVTIASPLGGHPGAGAGVAMSPIVLPAWRNLVPTGEFVTGLYATPLPEHVRYALFFAFQDAGGGDGVVPLTSQLRREAAEEADLVQGFVATHTGVLRLEATSDALAAELDRCRGDRIGAGEAVAAADRVGAGGAVPAARGAQ
jgi:hypothetical protein